MPSLAHTTGAALLLCLSLSSVASAQDVEPNNTCALAQNVGRADGRDIQGSLDAENASPTSDVDYFRFVGVPGGRVSVSAFGIGFFTRTAAFDESCNRLDFDPASFGRELDIPPSGALVIAVAQSADETFSGNGEPEFGSYQLSAFPLPDFIGSISGRVIDADSGLPIQTTSLFLPGVTLQLCSEQDCWPFVAARLDELGRFSFVSEPPPFGRRIPAGTIQLFANAFPEYRPTTLRIQVAKGEHVDVGDLALDPVRVRFSGTKPCLAIPPQGRTCDFSAEIQNPTTKPVTGIAQVLVRGDDFEFEASTRRSDRNVQRARLTIPPGESRPIAFSFDVPSYLPPFSEMCAVVQFGIDPSPLFHIERATTLFCVEKQPAGLRVLGPEETRAAADRMRAAPAQ